MNKEAAADSFVDSQKYWQQMVKQNCPAFYDDDDEYTIQYREYLENSSNAITPDLPTKEPDNSLSMGDEHLSTILETELDEVIKSSVEDLVPIPSEIPRIESLNDNATPDCALKSPSPFPIPVEDSDTFFEKSDTSLSYSDNSLTEFETFRIYEQRRDQGELTSAVMEDILGEPHVHVPNVLPTHPTLMMDSDFIPSDDSLRSDLEVSFPSWD
ncbi:hypothetical protein Tco_1343498 [Tanacetum coccineum]